MSTHLSDALERAIPGTGHGPALPPADDRLALGRRGVRRRRAAAGSLAAIAAVAAVVVPTALADGPAPDGRAPQVADGSRDGGPDGGATSSSQPTSPTSLVQLDVGADVPVLLDRGVTVVDEVEDPFARSEVFAWAGTVRFRGTTYWALTHRTGDGTFSTHTRPIRGRTIEQWVRDHEEVNTSGLRPWVDLRLGGSLSARDGVRIVEQRSPAREDPADPSAPSATAMLEVDGARLCVVVRAGARGSEQLALPESEHKGCRDLPGWEYPGNPSS
jgi:hypothetical protein